MSLASTRRCLWQVYEFLGRRATEEGRACACIESNRPCSSSQGLRPGFYEYKYIVDGMWVTDLAQPAECAQHWLLSYSAVCQAPPPKLYMPV